MSIFLPSGLAIRDGRIVFPELERHMETDKGGWQPTFADLANKCGKPLLVVRHEAGNPESCEAAIQASNVLVSMGYDTLVTDNTIEVVSPHGYPQLVYGTGNTKVPTKEEMDAVLKAARQNADVCLPSAVHGPSQRERELQTIADGYKVLYEDSVKCGENPDGPVTAPLMGKVRATVFVDDRSFNSLDVGTVQKSFRRSPPEVPVQCLLEDGEVERDFMHIIGKASNFACHHSPWDSRFEISCDLEVPESIIDHDSKTGLKYPGSLEIHQERGVMGVRVLVKRSQIK